MGLQSSRNMNLADPIIIAGLGGLGGGVIDSLKGKIKNDYDDNHIASGLLHSLSIDVSDDLPESWIWCCR